jgi:CHASE3 domain sensor protein
MKIINLVKNNAIVFAAILILVLVVSNTGFILYNSYILDKNTNLKAQTEQVRRINADIWNEIVRNLDVGFRGYAVTQDTGLLSPYNSSILKKDAIFKSLADLLQEQHYAGLAGLDSVKSEVSNYQQGCAAMIALVNSNQMDAVRQEMKLDKGKTLWFVYDHLTKRLYKHEDELNQQAEAEYRAATRRTAYLQLLLAIIGAPTLLFMIVRIRRDKNEKRVLFVGLEKNNRAYLFDPGTPMEVRNEQELINNSIVNFKKAASFINHISKGNYQVDWEGLDESNKQHNQSNLAGELIQMREKMKQLKAEDEKRLWATEGITQISEIIRSHQHNLQGLSEQILRFAVKYLAAQQGSLFLLREEEEEKYLELVGCYAFDRKKYVTKRIEIGQGLVGQTYLEQSPTVLTEIPQGYMAITSGLGDVTPTCLLVIPMKYNERVEAIIEIASFTKFEAHQVEWLEKVGEITASTLVAVKTAEKTKQLLEEFREQTEQMKAQEEELRQNMEEMQATQEEMRRKERELERRQQLFDQQ